MIMPLISLLPPLYQAIIPNLNQTPPHLKPKKAKSAPAIVPRRSHRLMSSIEKKKTGKVDKTIHVIVDSDEEIIQTESYQQPNPISTPKEIAPLTTNEKTTDLPPNKEDTPPQNLSDCVEIESQSIVVEVTLERPPSPIEIPREASPPWCDKEKEKEIGQANP